MTAPRRLSDVVSTDTAPSIAASLCKYGYGATSAAGAVARWLRAQGSHIDTEVAAPARPQQREPRPQQRGFRRALFEAYGGRCAITGCDVAEALEAAHVADWRSENDVGAGILLRVDLHRLFESGRLVIGGDYTVAWAGLSLERCIDHVVVPRIPFRPHSVEDEARRRFLEQLGFAASTVEGLMARDRGAAVRRTLAQGLGRGLRGPHERCTVWLLDPRFPLPKSMTREIGGPDQGLAADHLALMYCIPARFRTGLRPAVERGRIWPLATDDRPMVAGTSISPTAPAAEEGPT